MRPLDGMVRSPAIAATEYARLDAAADLPDRAAPVWGSEQLKRAVEDGRVDAHEAINEIARLSPSAAELEPWLTGLVDRAKDIGFDRWSPAHEAAMSALRALNAEAEAASAYAFSMPTSEHYALGEAIYHDEAIGCVRCHGADGRGLEGFPALARSPWVLGNPERAASIVVSGLYGKVHMPDGRTFNSAMEPLGGVLNDAQIAHTLTYIRTSWGNLAEPVEPATVARARANAPGGAWNIDTLALLYPLADDRIIGARHATSAAGPARTGHPLVAAFMSLGLLLVPTLAATVIAVVLGMRVNPTTN